MKKTRNIPSVKQQIIWGSVAGFFISIILFLSQEPGGASHLYQLLN